MPRHPQPQPMMPDHPHQTQTHTGRSTPSQNDPSPAQIRLLILSQDYLLYDSRSSIPATQNPVNGNVTNYEFYTTYSNYLPYTSYTCKTDEPTIGKRVQWNRLRWFGHVCRMDNSHLPKQLLWAEHPTCWRCPPNVPRKQCKDQVAANVTIHLSRRLYCDPLMAANGMTTERGAWQGLRYDITGINRRHDQSSERTHLEVLSVVG